MLSELNRSVPPEVTDFNGLEVNIVDQEDSVGVSRLTCVFRGGIAECGSISVAKMLPNLMLEGTFGHPDGGMSELIEFNGARIAFSVEPHYTSMTLFSLNSQMKIRQQCFSTLCRWGNHILLHGLKYLKI